MRFDEKARENLEAAARLLPDESGELDALSNASASRSYYATYHAIADRAQLDGAGFTDGDRTYYRHDFRRTHPGGESLTRMLATTLDGFTGCESRRITTRIKYDSMKRRTPSL